MPAREGCYAEFPPELDLRLVSALRKRGIERLYRHQREAWDWVAQSTPTASGKTLCYNLPVLQVAIQDQAKSLYLFPTKALSQDQVAEILELPVAWASAPTPSMATLRATPQSGAHSGRYRCLQPRHVAPGILPHHTKWAQFFESLRFVVIDELHTYRGLFGSHMANVVRRLRDPRTRRWRVTLYGRRVMGTSLYLRDHYFPKAYSRIAA